MFKKLSILLFCFFIMVFASAQTFNVDGINYNVTSATTVEVGDNTSFTGNLILPLTVTNSGTTYNVTSIKNNAFDFCDNLFSVTIPDSVTSIGDYAFELCSSLTSVTIGNSVTSIGNYAFVNCFSISSLTMGNSVTSIGDYAFQNCNLFTSLAIPNSVTSIGNNAFEFCGDLTSLTLGNSVTSIGNSAFRDCTSLTSLTIPNSVTSIGTGAFNNCTGLTSIKIPSSITSINQSTFQNCYGLTSLTIPDSVTNIGISAFDGCSGLTSIVCDIVTPLTIDTNVFNGVNKTTCTLSVPSSSVSAYKAKSVWMDFTNIIAKSTLNTTEYNIKKNIVLYPNPIHNEAFLELKNSESSKLEVYDMNGKMVLRKSLNNNSKNTVNTNNLPNGIYLFKVGKSVTKVVKN